jgi:hypothetical protein
MLVSRERVLAVLAGNSLVLGLLESPRIVRLWGWVSDAGEVVIPVFFTTISLSHSLLGALGFLAGILLNIYVLRLVLFRTIGDNAMLSWVRDDRIALAFMFLFAIPLFIATQPLVGIGAYMAVLEMGGRTVPLSELVGEWSQPLSAGMALAVFVLCPPLVYWRKWQPLSPALRADALYEFYRRIDRSQNRIPDYSQYQTRLWYANGGPDVSVILVLTIFAEGAVFGVTSGLLGGVMWVTGVLFPLFELSVLAFVGIQVTSVRLPLVPTPQVDLQSRSTLRSVGTLTGTYDGLHFLLVAMCSVIPIVVLGILGVAGAVVSAVAMVGIIVILLGRVPVTGRVVEMQPTLEVFGEIGFLGTFGLMMFGLCLYVLWLWRGLAGQLAQHLVSDSRDDPEESLPRSYPPLTPMILGLAVLLIAMLTSGSVTEMTDRNGVLLAAAMIVIGALVYGGWWTRRQRGRPRSLAASMRAAYLTAFLLNAWLVILVTLAARNETSLDASPFVRIGAVLIGAVVVSYMPYRLIPLDLDSPRIHAVRMGVVVWVALLFVLVSLYWTVGLPLSGVAIGAIVATALSVLVVLLSYYNKHDAYGLDRFPRTPDAAERVDGDKETSESLP